MALFKRIKNLVALSKLNVQRDTVHDSSENRDIPILRVVEDLGDGHAEFLGEGTTEEFIDQERADKGTKPWYDKFNPWKPSN